MSDNLGGKFAPKKKEPLKAFYPVIGLILMAIAGAVGYFSSEWAYELLGQYVSNLPQDDFQMQMIVAFAIFLAITVVFAAIFAIFAPKPPKMLSEKALLAEKQDRERERLRAKKRKAQMRKKMKGGTRDLGDL